MVSELQRERRRAQHLFFVSLKYTKTCDVILNLLDRWQKMIERGMQILLERAKKKKKIDRIPSAPKLREELVLKYFRDPIVRKTIFLYSFFRKVPDLSKIKEHEFRKNVALRVSDGTHETIIDMEKLKEWNELLESFVDFTISEKKKRKK